MTTERLQELRKEYSAFSQDQKVRLRKVAARELKSRYPDLEEIGSSDVSISLFNLRDELGSWEEVVRYGLEEFGVKH